MATLLRENGFSCASFANNHCRLNRYWYGLPVRPYAGGAMLSNQPRVTRSCTAYTGLAVTKEAHKQIASS